MKWHTTPASAPKAPARGPTPQQPTIRYESVPMSCGSSVTSSSTSATLRCCHGRHAACDPTRAPNTVSVAGQPQRPVCSRVGARRSAYEQRPAQQRAQRLRAERAPDDTGEEGGGGRLAALLKRMDRRAALSRPAHV